MGGIEGLYSALSALIKQREDEERLVISADMLVDEVKDEVDVHSAKLEWYINFALRAAAEVALYQAGYRSVIKGKGYFASAINCDKPEYLARFFNNAKLTEQQKHRVVSYLKRRINEVGLQGQMSIDFDTGEIVEDVSLDALVEMLKADAGEAKEQEL